MRRFLGIAILFLYACCNNSESKPGVQVAPENSKTQVISLEGGLGTVSVSLPLRYDTTFRWIHYSDCGKPCERRKYRFQPKALPAYSESGYFYKTSKDSVEQFTIVHNPYIPVDDNDNTDNKEFITSFHDHKKYEILHTPALRLIKSDTIEKIGDRYFSIIIIDTYDTAKAQYSKKLLSTTTIRRGTIDFNFELLSKEKDSLTLNFIDRARYYLRTVSIVAGL